MLNSGAFTDTFIITKATSNFNLKFGSCQQCGAKPLKIVHIVHHFRISVGVVWKKPFKGQYYICTLEYARSNDVIPSLGGGGGGGHRLILL